MAQLQYLFSCPDVSVLQCFVLTYKVERAAVLWGSCSLYYIERVGLRRLQGSCWGF